MNVLNELISFRNVIKDLFKNGNYGMPKSLQISKFQRHLVNGIQFNLRMLRIVIPHIRPSIRNFACIDNNFALSFIKNLHLSR
jgi:hypothetical protein